MDKKSNLLAFSEFARDYSLDNFHCPITEQAAYHEAIWLPHQLFLGSKKDMDDIATSFVKIQENIHELCP